MASRELLDKLNEAIAREMQVSIQYMWQHVMAKGMDSDSVKALLRRIAIAEMMHAELIAERLDYLGEKPTTKPAEIVLGESLKEMIEIDKKAEEEAIEMYRDIIELAEKERDYTTRKLFEQILAEEEQHHGDFSSLLE